MPASSKATCDKGPKLSRETLASEAILRDQLSVFEAARKASEEKNQASTASTARASRYTGPPNEKTTTRGHKYRVDGSLSDADPNPPSALRHVLSMSPCDIMHGFMIPTVDSIRNSEVSGSSGAVRYMYTGDAYQQQGSDDSAESLLIPKQLIELISALHPECVGLPAVQSKMGIDVWKRKIEHKAKSSTTATAYWEEQDYHETIEVTKLPENEQGYDMYGRQSGTIGSLYIDAMDNSPPTLIGTCPFGGSPAYTLRKWWELSKANTDVTDPSFSDRLVMSEGGTSGGQD